MTDITPPFEIMRCDDPEQILKAVEADPNISKPAALHRLTGLLAAEEIYQAGLKWTPFDFESGMAALVKLSDPDAIFKAGRRWKRFDHDKGLSELIIMGSARYIYYAGLDWKNFNFKRAGRAVINIADPEFIFYAGSHWKQFNYTAGLQGLIASQSPKYIFKAGTLWREFNYADAWIALERHVADGALWRGDALAHPKWRPHLKKLWQDLCAEEATLAP